LNLILPWDFTFAVLAGRLRRGAGEKLTLWLETWSRLDALISLANFAALHPQAAFPEIGPGMEPVFTARALAHPLIPAERRIANDIRITSLGEVIVITGSNMAGKSTFLKTVGVNLCLAHAGGPVIATELRSLPFRLHTCMRISDSIADGFSYFYAEVKCLRSILDRLRDDDALPLLYLIDEIFRGTNNRERLQGSQAYTRALIGANGIGLIATHDLELAHLAEQSERTRNYHFQDSLEDGRLSFDYLLRPGASTTTNALRIMEMEGLPVDSENYGSQPSGTIQ
jgi:DNA mismatch repair ATPase MutS